VKSEFSAVGVRMSVPREYVSPTWDEIYEMLLTLAGRIRESGFKPDLIVGVSRGGWVPGRILSDLLANARTANVKIEFYVGIGKTSGKPVVTQPISEEISRKHVLVVDDVADTGESLFVALDHIRERGAGQIKTVTIYHKPHSKFKPDFFAETTPRWIVFPWERLETTLFLLKEAKTRGQDGYSVRETLSKCRIDERTIGALLKLADGASQ
jgi:hypoxanthine phosphoribosyltransferase